MFEDAVIVIYAAGIIQAIFLAISLLTLKIRNRQAVYALAAMILLMAIALVEQLADSSGAPIELALSLALELGLAPLLFIFVRSIVDPGWRAQRTTSFHFIPMIAALGLLGILHAVIQSGNLGIAHPQFGNLIITWVFVKMVYFTGYAVASEKVLRREIMTTKSTRAAPLRWVYRWLLLLFAAFVLSYLVFILFLAGVKLWQDSDVYAGVIMFGIVFSIAYFVLANRKILDQAPPKRFLVTDEIRRNADLISNHIMSARPHRDPDFSIETLMAKTGLSLVAVQAATAHLADGGFHEYLNRLRLEEFGELARDPKNISKTTLELAYAAGFNSKATFYRVFSAEKAMTPRSFRKNLKTV